MKSRPEYEARIVIVDDVPTAREMLGALLKIEGYQLFYASSGLELLEQLDQLNPDVILLDVMMPEPDGVEVCRKIRANEQWQHLPIILITALDSRQDLATGLNAGADDFIRKPVDGVELRARVRSMLRIKKQFDALAATLKLRENLAHMVVHDMRTPLTAILAYTELMKDGFITVNDTDDVIKLNRQVLRLNSFVNDILIQAKMEEDKLLLNWQDIDVRQLVYAVKENHNIVFQSKRIKLVLDMPEQSRLVPLDANLFQRILDNLLSNALKFSPPNGTVTVKVEYLSKADRNLRVKVIDQGLGIAVEDQERIFDKFEVADLRHQNDAPVGLGLAFAKQVVEAHNGKISVEPNKPEGSIFIVEI